MAIAFIPLLLIALLFSLVPVVGLILLQVYLSKMEKDWPGLIIPAVCFLNTIIALGISGLNFVSNGVSVKGVIYYTIIWILANIPTIVFYLIYRNVHKKQSPNKELDKMTIQDLS